MKLVLLLLLALALPLFLGITNVRILTVSPAFYEWGFRRHLVATTTGLTPTELTQVAQQFIAYFQAPPSRLSVTVQRGGSSLELLNEREIAHMVDVQALMRSLSTVQLVCGLVILGSLAGLAVLERRLLGSSAATGLIAGAGLTLGILLLLGLATVLGFSSFWTRFHLVAFSNDLWLLDPARDNLIRLFPPPFWAEATLLLAGMTALEAVLVGTLGLAALSGVFGNRTPVALGGAQTRAA